MALKVRLQRRAKADLAAIAAYLLQEAGEQAANRVRQSLQQRMLRLSDRPLLGTMTSNSRIRVLTPTKYPYRIYYSLTPTTVIILHIRHTARRPLDLSSL
jgi:toxin ParE1/3/4